MNMESANPPTRIPDPTDFATPIITGGTVELNFSNAVRKAPPASEYIDIDLRRYFNPYQLPKWEAVLSAIESAYDGDSLKVVKQLRGGDFGKYRILPSDMSLYNKDTTLGINGVTIQPEFRAPKQQMGWNTRDDLLVTLIDAYTGEWVGVDNTLFTELFRENGIDVVIPCKAQTYRHSNTFNGNRYIIVEKGSKVSNSITLTHPVTNNTRSFYTRYTGKVYDCRVCLKQHGGRCLVLSQNDQWRREREEHTIQNHC